METFSSDSDSRRMDVQYSPNYRRSASDEETYYTTVSSAPPKRRAGRTKFRETRHPVYKGVRRRNSSKWVCEVREPNKKSRIWLGTFPTADMAARAHDVAAIALRGRSACLNFADSAWLLPIPDSSNPRDIQRAAAEAAEAFRPSSERSRATGEEDRRATADSSAVTRRPSDAVPNYDPFCMEDGLYFDMAAGLLMDPPPLPPATNMDADSDGDVSLWSYSF